jgi:ribonuclease T2
MITKHWYLTILLAVAVLFAPPGHATIEINGYFIAGENCPAVHSIKKNTNPGNITLTKGMAYPVTAKNKPNETHYLVKIDGDDAMLRWVPVSCGTFLYDCKQKVGAQPTAAVRDYLLAVSWQPAFCETHREKPECATQTEDRYDAKNFSLHGLWPQPKDNAYCNVGSKDKTIDRHGHWHLLPEVVLTDPTFENLLMTMPGVASNLHRHEWIKHGTCYSDSPETYFRDSLALIGQLNDSKVRDFLAENIGRTITSEDIRRSFEESFGEGAGSKVNVRCNSKQMITELWIHLQGSIDETVSLGELLKHAPATSVDCPSGVVDSAGF